MSRITSPKQIEWYEIRVKGHLDRRRLQDLEDWLAVYQPSGETVLSGPLQDQAALYGLLNRLRDLGIPLLSLTRLEKKDGGWVGD